MLMEGDTHFFVVSKTLLCSYIEVQGLRENQGRQLNVFCNCLKTILDTENLSLQSDF